MLQSPLTPSLSPTSDATAAKSVAIVRRAVIGLAIATFGLMALGSATRVANAGLSCPDWPLCYGTLIPAAQMNLQVFLEWFHRLVASSVGFATLIFWGMVWWWRRSLPAWLPYAAGAAVAIVIVQGILGGLTVTELLKFEIVTAHLGTGMAFFSLLVAIAMGLLPYEGKGTAGRLAWLAGMGAVLVFGQCLLGALVASRWALHQCLADSGMGAALCAVMNAHLLGIVPASLGAIAVAVGGWKLPDLTAGLRGLAAGTGGLLLVQLSLGYATYRLQLQVGALTVAHEAVGAALLGTLVALAVLAGRDARNGELA